MNFFSVFFSLMLICHLPDIATTQAVNTPETTGVVEQNHSTTTKNETLKHNNATLAQNQTVEADVKKPTETNSSVVKRLIAHDNLQLPSGGLIVMLDCFIILIIFAMVYLVVKNLRMRYATFRGERYGFHILHNRPNHEVQPLSGRDDDEEEILFDVRSNLR